MPDKLPSFVRGELDFDIHEDVVDIFIDGAQVSALSIAAAKRANATLAAKLAEHDAKSFPREDEGRSGATH